MQDDNTHGLIDDFNCQSIDSIKESDDAETTKPENLIVGFVYGNGEYSILPKYIDLFTRETGVYKQGRNRRGDDGPRDFRLRQDKRTKRARLLRLRSLARDRAKNAVQEEEAKQLDQ